MTKGNGRGVALLVYWFSVLLACRAACAATPTTPVCWPGRGELLPAGAELVVFDRLAEIPPYSEDDEHQAPPAVAP